ncbi:hypothetical protein J7I98_19940 [Streptomyces sp. ISL-98]|nr:hypothetical protein [Streptomyces sp. ISL-98]
MSESFERIQDYPGVMPAIYDVGPQFLFIGLIALVAAAAAGGAASAGHGSRAVGWWALALVVVGTAAMASNLDLMPVGGACYVLALGALARSAVPAGGTGRATAVGRG